MVRVAVVGVGYWGPNFARLMDELSDARLVAVCDKDSKKLDKLRGSYPNATFTGNVEEIIAAKDIDAVVVATGSDSHYEITRRCLEAGKHVLVEKPLALNARHAEDLIAAAAGKKLVLLVGHLLRYHRGVIRLKQYIDDGFLGRVRYVYTTRVNLGRIRKEENALWSFATHDISVIDYLVDAEAQAVSATGQAYVRKGVYDVVFLTIHFPGDVMAHLHVSWLDPHKIRQVTVVGDKKMAVLDDMEATEKLRIYDKGVDLVPSYGSYGESLTLRVGDIFIPKIDLVEPLKAECQHFLNCILKGDRPLTDGESGLKVVRVLEAAERSLREGGCAIKIGN
ncbi:MAG TPA: Gfo/Idh/MocA family oxidoreductase [bacterium]|nr:Gfo/Idh/MocA family oxidoreductase [bacterium]